MSRLAFVTDSTCNLPDELVQRYNITVVPVYVIFGESSYKDYVEMPPAEFYRRLVEYKAAGKGMPTTSQPTPEDFRATYRRLVEQGATDIISIHVTAKSSGTCQSAQLAAELIGDAKVHVVDSTTTSMQMGFMLFAALEAVAAGGGASEALAAIEHVKAHSCLHFTVTDVEHLSASGRTEGHERVAEAAISTKPIIAVTDGVPKALGAERTQRAALQKVLDFTSQRIGAGQVKQLAIVNGNIPDKANEWAVEAARALNFTGQPFVVDFGPALAVHFGPGLLGAAVEWA
ncbi:MAG TPA: DegV family protein [Anaerolineae bacterium]|nr:DegV family protein [Anaerolineae bacterium]